MGNGHEPSKKSDDSPSKAFQEGAEGCQLDIQKPGATSKGERMDYDD